MLKQNMMNFFLLTLFVLALSTTVLACKPGHFRAADSSCKQCLPGTYKTDTSNYPCLPCSQGTFMPNSAAKSCWTCPTNALSSLKRTGCVCRHGSVWNTKTKTCDDCAAGNFFVAGATRTCNPCRPGTYQPYARQPICLKCSHSATSGLGATKCISCPPGEAILASSNCGKCPPGQEFHHFDRSCQACKLDHFKANAGQHPCVPCARNAHAPAGSKKCVQCTANTALMRNGKCESCQPGQLYNPYERKCSKCPPGTFSPLKSVMELCYVCAGHSYAFPGSATCIKCAWNQSLVKNGRCTSCPSGHYYDNVDFRCIKCRSNHVSHGGIANTCRTCPRGSFSRPVSSTCFICGNNKAYIASVNRCDTCTSGKFYDHSTAECYKCPFGSVKPGAGNELCQDCPSGYEANKERTACVVNVGSQS